MTTFDSAKTSLDELLCEIKQGKIQLPDFQRGWVWDDDHIRDLLVSIGRSFPIGAVMLLEAGGEVRFETRPVEGLENILPKDSATRETNSGWAAASYDADPSARSAPTRAYSHRQRQED